MFSGIRSYILEDDFKITILDKKINVVNYKERGHFDNNQVIIRYLSNKILIIKGKNLSVARLKKNEVLIEGTFSSLEFR